MAEEEEGSVNVDIAEEEEEGSVSEEIEGVSTRQGVAEEKEASVSDEIKGTDVASKTIDSRGGTIQLRRYGISLCIPASALQTDCKITLKVLPHPPSVLLNEDEAIVSPCVVCEPLGTTFERPLQLIIPHCALLTDPSKANVTMHFIHGDTKVAKKVLSSTGTPRCVVRKDDLEVYIDHFSIWEVFMVISEYFIGKRVASTPYLPKSMSRLQSQNCHLRLHNDTPGLQDLIKTEEESLGYCKMAPTQKMSVFWQKGELKIICEVDSGHVTENEKIVSTRDIYRLEQNAFAFLVEATGDAYVDVKFIFHPHCDEGHEFRVKFSDPDWLLPTMGWLPTMHVSSVSSSDIASFTEPEMEDSMLSMSEMAEMEESMSMQSMHELDPEMVIGSVIGSDYERSFIDRSEEVAVGTDMASKTIDYRGGTIQLRHYGISLCIPDSALQTDCKITLKVLPHPSSVLVNEDEAIVSPCVVCEPSGTTFERPLKLIIPHCAVLTDPSKAKVTMHFTHGDTKVANKVLSSTGTPRCVVRKDDLEVYIDHFSIWEVFMVISEYFIGKRVASTPYLPKSMSRLQSQYCHLRLYNDTPGLQDLIKTEEESLGYCKKAPTQTMFVFWQKGELKIRCEVDGGHVTENEKIVSTSNIYRLERNVVSFEVKATGDADVYFKFIFHPHCDEGHAFRAEFSGAITALRPPSPGGHAKITKESQSLTNSKSPRPSASKPVDISSPGAPAAVGEVPTPDAREVNDEMINNLAKQIPSDDYYTFSQKLGIKQNTAKNIVEAYRDNYEQATRDCIVKWRNRSTRTVADLHEALREADLAGLIVYCN